jgi:hypothetical protein
MTQPSTPRRKQSALKLFGILLCILGLLLTAEFVGIGFSDMPRATAKEQVDTEMAEMKSALTAAKIPAEQIPGLLRVHKAALVTKTSHEQLFLLSFFVLLSLLMSSAGLTFFLWGKLRTFTTDDERTKAAATPTPTVPSKSYLAEVRVSKVVVTIVGAVLAIVFSVVGGLLVHMLPHHVHVGFDEWQAEALLVSFVLLIPIHEALHALGLRIFAGVPWRHIRFGVDWHWMAAYCACSDPITVKAFRRMALLPLWGTGAITIAAAIFFPTEWLGAFAGFTVATCVADVWTVVKLRGISDTLLVQDSPSELGCDIIAPMAQAVV